MNNTPQLATKKIVGRIINCTQSSNRNNQVTLYTNKKVKSGEHLLVKFRKKRDFYWVHNKYYLTMLRNRMITNSQESSTDIYILDKKKVSLYFKIRNKIISDWIKHFGFNNQIPSQGIVLALIFGEQNSITRYQWYLLQKTATAHLVAVSGLHIQLIAKRIQNLSRRLFAWGNFLMPRVWSSILSMVIVTAYSYLAGFGVACQRATICFILSQCNQHHIIKSSGLSRLAWCSLITCAYDPVQILKPSYILSYGMVISIIMINKLRPKWHWLSIQIAITAVSIPFNIFFWHETMWQGAISNMYAIPWVNDIILPLALFTSIMGYLAPKASYLLLQICYKVIDWLFYVLEQTHVITTRH
ncbi:MAG: ComEC/Rec2 family competence protein [Pseudomonadota bacterium]|nr:ComEC/Rec2 family competence protein [Pseudomonadota bacterium]